MGFGKLQVRPGMDVVKTAGDHVGRVEATENEDFILSRGDSSESVRVPYEEVRAILGNQVVLGGPDTAT